MEKLSLEMDLDDWEFLPDHDDFLDEHGGRGKGKGFDPKGVIRPFPTSCLTDIAPMIKKNQEVDHELNKVPFIDIGVVPTPIVEKEVNLGGVVADQETVSRVFFKKMKENEFADMKMDSPKGSGRGLKLLTEGLKEEAYKVESPGYKSSSAEVTSDQVVKKKKNLYMDPKKGEDHWEGCLNIWGWKVSGVGALCCIGVAAATTICIVVFGSRGGSKQHNNNNNNQKIQVQLHSDDKKTNQVGRQEQLLNQAISAARSIPLSGAHIFYGDY